MTTRSLTTWAPFSSLLGMENELNQRKRYLRTVLLTPIPPNNHIHHVDKELKVHSQLIQGPSTTFQALLSNSWTSRETKIYVSDEQLSWRQLKFSREQCGKIDTITPHRSKSLPNLFYVLISIIILKEFYFKCGFEMFIKDQR